MRKKSRILVIIIFTLLSAVAFWRFIGHDYLEKAQESEALTAIAAIMTAEKAYHDEYGTYTTDYLALGYSSEGKPRVDLYLTTQALPSEYRLRLKAEDLPMISEDSYRIVAILKKNSKIFIQEKGKLLRTVEPSSH